MKERPAVTPGPWHLIEGQAHPWMVGCDTGIPGAPGMVAQVGYKPNAVAISALPLLMSACVAAAVQFESYAAEHERKATPDGTRKAETNRRMALGLREALAVANGEKNA